MDLDRVERPLRKLRKLLKSLPENAAPEDVHKMRTRARRIEAVANALKPAAGKETRRLLKAIKPVRKAAGGVRDMDVLTRNLLDLDKNGLQKNGSRDSLVRLIEHLGSERSASATGLAETVDRQRKAARRELKNYARLVESVTASKKPVQRAEEATHAPFGATEAGAEDLAAELRRWPRLNAANLHDFRLKVKALRYVLQASPGSDTKFIDALGHVKDEIGDWHDWQQLLEIARNVLNRPEDRELLAEIETIIGRKFARALAAANSMRRRFLRPSSPRRKAS
jgi:CHAD domain-containing protein